MAISDNWPAETLERLERNIWPADSNESYLVQTCNSLRKKPLREFGVEDLRIMIGQEIGLAYLVPMALDVLKQDLFAEGDFYPGDLLKSMLEVPAAYWKEHPGNWKALHALISDHKEELRKQKLDTRSFEALSLNLNV